MSFISSSSFLALYRTTTISSGGPRPVLRSPPGLGASLGVPGETEGAQGNSQLPQDWVRLIRPPAAPGGVLQRSTRPEFACGLSTKLLDPFLSEHVHEISHHDSLGHHARLLL
jgi:hypothetical protein